MSPNRIGFDRAGSSGQEPQEEVKGSGPVEGDDKVEINLDDEPGTFVRLLNAWWEKVVIREIPKILGLARPARSPNLSTGLRAHFSEYDSGRSPKEDGRSPPERARVA